MIWFAAGITFLIGFVVGVVFVEYFVEDFERDEDGRPIPGRPRGKLVEGRSAFHAVALGALTATIIGWMWFR